MLKIQRREPGVQRPVGGYTQEMRESQEVSFTWIPGAGSKAAWTLVYK